MDKITVKSIFNYEYEVVKYFDGMPMKILFVGISSFKYHWHKEIEIIFVLKGSIGINIEEKRYELKKGDFIVINNFTAHAFESLAEDNMLMIVQFDPKICNGDGKKDIYFFNCNSAVLERDKEVSINIFRKSMANLGREMTLKRGGYEHYIKSYFYSIIGLLIRQFSIKDNNKIKIDEFDIERIKNILSYIDKNYCQEISLDAAANFINMSPSRFSHMFKEKVGISFKRYLTLVRIERAKELLKTTNYTILRIANECGFNNESLLYRLFNAYVGITPNGYRKKSLSQVRKEVPSGYIFFDSNDILSAICQFIKG